jgi:hypothetical protein
MLELCIAMVIIGAVTFFAAATNHFNVANILAWVVGGLLFLYVLVKAGKKDTAHNSNGYKN